MPVRRPRAPRRATLVLALVAGLAGADRAEALNYVTTANGETYGIHDAAAPGLDTGSIRDVSTPGANRANAVFGFGGLRMHVPDIPADDPTGRFDGQLMRGFGLRFNANESFTTTTPVPLGGVLVSRDVRVLKSSNAVRFLDSFTNTRTAPVTVDVVFGGTAGTGVAGNASVVSTTSDGDAAIEPGDAYVTASVPSAADPARSARGPLGVVLGSPAPFAGALSGTGNFQRDPFGTPLPTTGLDANFYGFTNRVTLQPGETRTLLHYVVTGLRETTADGVDPGAQTAAVTATTRTLATTPDLSGISRRERCELANFNGSVIPAVEGPADCTSLAPADPVAAPATPVAVTSSPYDVVHKSVAQLQADMTAGTVTSQQITRAYLDRIAAYDTGQWGFHAFITVNRNAMAMAKAADDRRAAGESGPLLGIPIALKDLYDTRDMPTTDGTRALEGWQPKSDAFQVARMRAAGAVFIGKTNLSEFANSGSYSDSGYTMSWNALNPSKTTLGSSGGSADATALGFAAISMGTQTGVSLYAPSTGASLVSLRGTDGISSGAGVMPLTYLQDFEGPIAQTTTDVAMLLDVTTGTDPDDPATVHADADHKRPADWTTALDAGALRGKRIGYVPAAFDATTPYDDGDPATADTNPYPTSYGQTDGTGQALLARFADLQAAGATMVPMTGKLPVTAANPSTSGRSRTEEGWQAYWDRHPEGPFRTAADILSSPKNLPYNQQAVAPAPRLRSEDVQAILAARDQSKANYAAWMDANGVDAVVYPGFRSDVYDNDGAQTISSDRNTGIPTSNFGLPTLILPVGANPHGYNMSLQIVGRAFDDAKVLGYGYALEQQLGGANRVLTAFAPKLPFSPDATPVQPVAAAATAPSTTAPAPAKPEETAPAGQVAGQRASSPLRVAVVGSARVRGRTVRVTLANRSAVAVTGPVTLRGRTVVRVGGKRRVRTVRFGTAHPTLKAGRRTAVVVRLNAAGRKALRGRGSVRLLVGFALAARGAETASASEKVTARR